MLQYVPFFLQKYLVAKTTKLLAKQYRSFAFMYTDSFEAQTELFEQVIRFRYHNQPDKAHENTPLPRDYIAWTPI